MGEESEVSSMSSMSSVSSVDSSVATGTEQTAQGGDWKRRAIIPVTVITVVILLLVGIYMLTSTTSSGSDVSDDDGSGGENSDDGSHASYSGNPPAPPTPPTPPSTKTTSTSTSTTVKPATDLVLCTVTPGRYDGWKPRTPLVLPSDGLCDYLFISKMQLYLFTLPNQTNVNKLQPFDLDEGLEKFYGDWSPLDAFMNYTASYKQTELGADMDHLFDILILITSTSIGMRSGPKGFPAPNEMDGTFPWHFNMEQGSKYANEIYTYKTKKPMVGISLQMAATRLLTNASYYSSSVIDYIRHTSPDKACEAPSKNRKYLPAPAWLSWVTNKTWTETFIYDDNKTFQKKVSYARKLNRYPKFAWLVYNVHLAPTSSKCNWDQYYLLKLLKGMY